MSKKKPSRSALRRRSRPERAPRGDAPRGPHEREILSALERAGSPLTPGELAKALRLPRSEKDAFQKSLSALERAGENITGKVICALGDTVGVVTRALMKKFPEDFKAKFPERRG